MSSCESVSDALYITDFPGPYIKIFMKGFGILMHYGKAHEHLLSGRMIYNHMVCCWPTTSSKYFDS